MEYVDLYLVHFPISLKFVPFETRYPPEWVHDPTAATPAMELAPVPMCETWTAMEALVPAGLAKNIGVCNFNTAGLRDLLSYATILPAVLQVRAPRRIARPSPSPTPTPTPSQVELHPYLQQPKLLRFAAEHDIAVTGFS